MTRFLGFTLLLASVAGVASGGSAVAGPEIDASSGVAAAGLLCGAILVLRSRRKK
ncbi:MAG TPA: hypothetical protein VKE70_00200 [Candidatus Solibacter sp.]|nr:hypothetical protein [Candidatus Solibacter sp.]